MATEIPQRELRNNPGALLARVAAGEELTITTRGRPVADLVPVREVSRAGATFAQLHAVLHGLLADDDELLADVRSTEDVARDPWDAPAR